MKLRVPFVYEATVLPKKARNPRAVWFGEFADVDIKEVSDFDAPVALRWAAGAFNRDGIDGVNERRWFDGSFWEPAIYYYSGRPNEHIDAANMAEATQKGHSHSLLIRSVDWRVRDFLNGTAEGALHSEDYRLVHSSFRDEELEKTLAIAGDTLIVDGKVWQRSFEPVYRVSDSGTFQRYVRLNVEKPPEDLRAQEGVFRLDRFDDLVAYALEKFGEEIDEKERVQVLVPEALAYDDEYPALLGGLKRVVQSQRDKIGDRETAEIMAWAVMRDAVREMEASPDDRTINAAIERAQEWIEVTAADEFWTEPAVSAIKRWSVRPIQLDDDAPGAFRR